jgi:hypothetical protein
MDAASMQWDAIVCRKKHCISTQQYVIVIQCEYYGPKTADVCDKSNRAYLITALLLTTYLTATGCRKTYIPRAATYFISWCMVHKIAAGFTQATNAILCTDKSLL